MKKKVLALLLGGVMAVGGLSLQVPATVQAATYRFDECDLSSSDSHIKSSQVSMVNGQLTVTIDIDYETKNGYFCLYVFDKPLEKTDFYDYSYYETWWGEDSVAMLKDLKDSGTYTFDGLAGDKTYYVYCNVADNHEINGWGEGGDPEDVFGHRASYLGASGSGNSSSDSSSDNSSSDNTPSGGESSGSCSDADDASYEETVTSQIQTAQPGSTIVIEKGISALSNSVMKELLEKGDVSLKLEFTYEDKEYVIIIPAGAALDNDIPWYGPLYLAQHFGNKAGTNASGTGSTYEVRSGDSMSAIAAANNMTLKQLMAKNPQIKDPNKIFVGEKINR